MIRGVESTNQINRPFMAVFLCLQSEYAFPRYTAPVSLIELNQQ